MFVFICMCVYVCVCVCEYMHAHDVEYRYNAANYIERVTSSISIANSIHRSILNSQQTPHDPPSRANHGTSTVSHMDEIYRVISMVDCIYVYICMYLYI